MKILFLILNLERKYQNSDLQYMSCKFYSVYSRYADGDLTLTYKGGDMCHHNNQQRTTIINFICNKTAGNRKKKNLCRQKMSVKCIPPYTPLAYSKKGVYRRIPIFLIFDPKHRLWVLVRTTFAKWF